MEKCSLEDLIREADNEVQALHLVDNDIKNKNKVYSEITRREEKNLENKQEKWKWTNQMNVADHIDSVINRKVRGYRYPCQQSKPWKIDTTMLEESNIETGKRLRLMRKNEDGNNDKEENEISKERNNSKSNQYLLRVLNEITFAISEVIQQEEDNKELCVKSLQDMLYNITMSITNHTSKIEDTNVKNDLVAENGVSLEESDVNKLKDACSLLTDSTSTMTKDMVPAIYLTTQRAHFNTIINHMHLENKRLRDELRTIQKRLLIEKSKHQIRTKSTQIPKTKNGTSGDFEQNNDRKNIHSSSANKILNKEGLCFQRPTEKRIFRLPSREY